jgi:selenocysteine lyase/cysteine desulfurase
MSLKPHFSRFLQSDPDRLHFAAHSHHPWPDVSFEAHQQAWLDASQMMDNKWGHIYGEVIPETARRIARVIGLSDPSTLTFAPNTHEFVLRIFSCFEPPVRVLTTDSEFHSFTRQSRRWEEDGLALIDRVPAEPFYTFSERFTQEARGGNHDLIFISEVFFNSGFVVPGLDRIVSSVSEQQTFIVIDGYHAFMARPVDIGAIQDRVFYLAGGYKYAMSGEGVCFLHSPPGYGDRPVDTGWYAGFGQLESGVTDLIPYAKDGTRFSGATFDVSGIYRMNAVLRWLEQASIGPAEISAHVQALQGRFTDSGVAPGELMPPQPFERGNFLTYRTADAEHVYNALHDRGIVTDYRSDRLRIGFGIYQDDDDVDRLAADLRGIAQT